eukprot:3404328-Pyramimonas_sp.AAC.1
MSQPFETEGLSPRLDLTVRKARELAAARPQDLVALAGWTEHCSETLEEWADDFQEARDGLDRNSKQSWDQWQTEALSGSARRMHRLTRLKAHWQPTVIETSPGIYSSDPR